MSISTPKSARHLRIAPPSDPNVRCRVLLGVAHDDETAPAPHELVESEVLEVAAVGEVHELREARGLARAARRRGTSDANTGPGRSLGSRPSRIAEPPTEPRIEDGQQERHRTRRVKAHVGAGSGTGNRDRGADVGTAGVRVTARLPVAIRLETRFLGRPIDILRSRAMTADRSRRYAGVKTNDAALRSCCASSDPVFRFSVNVHDRIRPEIWRIRRFETVLRRCGRERGDREVVQRIEAGQWVRLPRLRLLLAPR